MNLLDFFLSLPLLVIFLFSFMLFVFGLKMKENNQDKPTIMIYAAFLLVVTAVYLETLIQTGHL